MRAERILAEAERAKAEAGEFSGAVRGRVVIEALQSLVEIKLPSLLAAFNRRYHEVEVAKKALSETELPAKGSSEHAKRARIRKILAL